MLNAVAKASKEILEIFNFASDVISFAMDENPKIIPTGFAPLDFLVAMVMPSIAESILESWDAPVHELAEKAKDKGLKGVDYFLSTSGSQEDRYKYKITQISQEILDKLLKGEFKTIDEITDLKRNQINFQSPLSYTLFHYFKKLENEDKIITVIDSIFINQ